MATGVQDVKDFFSKNIEELEKQMQDNPETDNTIAITTLKEAKEDLENGKTSKAMLVIVNILIGIKENNDKGWEEKLLNMLQAVSL